MACSSSSPRLRQRGRRRWALALKRSKSVLLWCASTRTMTSSAVRPMSRKRRSGIVVPLLATPAIAAQVVVSAAETGAAISSTGVLSRNVGATHEDVSRLVVAASAFAVNSTAHPHNAAQRLVALLPLVWVEFDYVSHCRPPRTSRRCRAASLGSRESALLVRWTLGGPTGPLGSATPVRGTAASTPSLPPPIASHLQAPRCAVRRRCGRRTRGSRVQ